MTVQELIDNLNKFPKNAEIYCKDLWEGSYKEISEIIEDSNDGEPLIILE